MPLRTSPRPLASGLVALVAAGGLLLSGTPALAADTESSPLSVTAPAQSATVPDRLEPGKELLPGQYLTSGEPGGGYTFRMQDDGNAVTYDAAGRAVFSTGTTGRGNRLVLQEDGNVVIYSVDGRPLWSTGTDIDPPEYLVMQGDGNLVLYREDLYYTEYAQASPAWASSVNGRIAEPAVSTLSIYDALLWGHQLTSPNGLFRAVMQRDGNLVGYGPNGVIWSTGTHGSDNWLTGQRNTIVVERPDGTPRWVAEVKGEVDDLILKDNGVLTALDKDDAVLWTSQSGLPGSSMYAPNTLEIDELLRSDDGQYRAVMQADGNLVVYGPTGAIWQTGTAGADSALEFSKDGTARVVAGDGAVTWSAKPATGGVGPFHLVMQGDGNLVAYDVHDRAVWSSR